MSSRREKSSKRREERLARERAEQSRKRKKRIVTVAVAAVIVVLGTGAFLLTSGGASYGFTPGDAVDTGASSDRVVLSVANVGTTARFNTYDAGGTTVRFFEARDDQGNIHVAIDACDVCYANKKGYRQVGDSMICNNCGNAFKLSDIGTANTAGGCWPSYLPVTVDGDNIVINKSDLDAKAFMFR